MIDIGHFALVAAFFLTVYGLVVGSFAAFKNNQRLVLSAAHSVYLSAALSVVSLIALAQAFLAHDYHYLYVWQTSNNAMHPMYLIGAIWGGMEGSMLLWAVLVCLYGAVALSRSPVAGSRLWSWLVPCVSFASCFFIGVVTLLTNPFVVVPEGSVLLDGNGLNPLLQNPSMMIHPPLLYLGFTGFVVPFAYACAALLSNQVSTQWTLLTRRWTLIAWGFLTAGIILGGNWAYIELGWGGFWAWDPVENASFLPWLTATALLHSVMVQQYRGMLKVWNVVLSCLTYLLTVFGTFLTRSGIVQSVHAFAETDVGWVFLVYMGVLTAFVVGLLIAKRRLLYPDQRLESMFSREAAFLFNNLLLLAVCFSTLWGVLFPVFSEAMTGVKQVVGPPFFNAVNVPLFLALMFLMGVGPLIAWRKASAVAFKKLFIKPFAIGCLLTAGLLIYESEQYLAAISFGLCLFVLITVFGEYHRAVKARRNASSMGAMKAVVQVVRSRPARYGGFLVHLGVAVVAFSITTSMAYKVERDITISKGESATVKGYTLELTSLDEVPGDNYTALIAEIDVKDSDGNFITHMHPERRLYHKSGEMTSEVDIRSTLVDDLYLAVAGTDASAPATKENPKLVLKVFVNPFQVWLWIGTVIVLLGTLLALLPDAHKVFDSVSVEEAATAVVRS